MVVFEDLHWADSESIALFERIADLEGDRLLLETHQTGRGDPAQPDRRPFRETGPAAPATRRHHVQLERWVLAETSAYLTSAIGRATAELGLPRRCTTAPEATRSSSKSSCAACRAMISRSSASVRSTVEPQQSMN